MAKEKFITGIDIGASKVCCLIGEKNTKNTYDILGCGIVYHDCVKRGAAVDLKGLSDVISKAVYRAETESNKKVSCAYINLAAHNMKGIPCHGETIISDRDSEITRYDAERVTKIAKSINMPYEREIFYTVHHGYTLDNERGIFNPSGMFGFKLEADLYLITVNAALAENLKKALRQAGIGVAGMVITSMPNAMALLSEHEKKIGTILIDIGADLVDISIYTDGLLRYIKIIPAGGDYITDCVSKEFKLPEAEAEKVKIENSTLDGKFSAEEKVILTANSRRKIISKSQLQEIMRQAYKNIFNMVKSALEESRISRDAANGVVLCGSPSVTEGLAEKAEIELGCPVRVGHITELGSCSRPLPSGIFTTAVGLVKYGVMDAENKKGILEKGAKNLLSSFLNQARSLYREYF